MPTTFSNVGVPVDLIIRRGATWKVATLKVKDAGTWK